MMADVAGRRIPLRELQGELAAAREAAEGWSRRNVAAARDRKGQHLAQLGRSKAEIAALEERHGELRRQVADLQQGLADQRAREEALQANVKKSREAKCSQANSNLRYQASLEAACASMQSQETALAQQDKQLRSKLSLLREVHQIYQRALGLEFRPSEGTEELGMVFKDVDPDNPDQTYCLSLHVQDDGSYAVSACEPPLPELESLTAALKDSNDLSKFIRGARKAFRAHSGRCSSSSADKVSTVEPGQACPVPDLLSLQLQELDINQRQMVNENLHGSQ